MSVEKRMETARTWLKLAREEGEWGDAISKRSFLAEKGFSEEELDELMAWDRKDACASTER